MSNVTSQFLKSVKGRLRLLLALAFSLALLSVAGAVRIKDICSMEGMRDNQLVGYGLVVGLDGTGDDQGTGFTIQSLAAFMNKHRIQVDSNSIDAANVAAVMVTATLPPFARQGMKIDVVVSSIGDAESLQGGTLIATPLRPVTADPTDSADIFAVAQGTISTGGYAVSQGSTSLVKNHPNVALLPDGAIIEREVPNAFATKPEMNFLLRNPDFTTAVRVEGIINATIGDGTAIARNPTVVSVRMPESDSGSRVAFISQIEGLLVSPDSSARVVYNERTGTIVMGANVRISTSIIAHGSLTLKTSEPSSTVLIQDRAYWGASDTIIQESDPQVEAIEEEGQFGVLEEGVTIG
ncbi:flagellar basal body P-ring protein FlgI, partial [bacterium]|nr:flagellar basal body P-ring protein FlgI [bacterium]